MISFAAGSYPNAASRGFRKGTMVRRILKPRCDLSCFVAGADAQIIRWIIYGNWINQLAGFMRFRGSQSDLNSAKACMSSGPNILGRSAARA
jgi:hypothetical protein